MASVGKMEVGNWLHGYAGCGVVGACLPLSFFCNDELRSCSLTREDSRKPIIGRHFQGEVKYCLGPSVMLGRLNGPSLLRIRI